MKRNKKIYLIFKRLLDIVISFSALILLAPLFGLVVLVVKFDSKGPFLFKQKRIGINNTTFYILKFRTMRIDAPKEAPTDQLSNAQSWITRSGNILRKTSIDELPQLINILLGQMSIVGPRPALWNQYKLNELRTQANIHTIKPGLTGWAQVNGRDENDDFEKVYWDKEYLDNYNFIFDVKCILRTITAVFSSKGIMEGGMQNAESKIGQK